MDEVEKIWLNGKFVDWKDANIHLLTHALHYGSAVFEGIRCYDTPKGPAVFRLKDHVKRLFGSAHIFGMEIPYSQKDLVNAILELIKLNKIKECYIRPIAYYGYGKMGLNPIGAKVDVGIAVWPWGAYLGEDGVKNGIRMKISSLSRHHINSMPTKAKVSGNYVNSIMAKVEAVKGGYEEAILLDTNGYVSECTGENIFIVRNGALITPPKENILEGITRDSIIQIAEDFKVPFEEDMFTRDQLYLADEAFLTGTAAEITPIREVDDRKIGEGKPGAVTKKLQSKYYEIIHGKDSKYFEWLDFVEKK